MFWDHYMLGASCNSTVFSAPGVHCHVAPSSYREQKWSLKTRACFQAAPARKQQGCLIHGTQVTLGSAYGNAEELHMFSSSTIHTLWEGARAAAVMSGAHTAPHPRSTAIMTDHIHHPPRPSRTTSIWALLVSLGQAGGAMISYIKLVAHRAELRCSEV